MRIGFWNIHKGASQQHLGWVKEFTSGEHLDLLILIESGLEPASILEDLNAVQVQYFFVPQTRLQNKFQVFTKFSDQHVYSIRENSRVAGMEIHLPQSLSINVVLVHLQSKLHFTADDQNFQIQTTRDFINQLEADQKHDRTIILGDFNMDPFQGGMIQAHGMHAVFDKAVARKAARIVDEVSYKYLYNPMWSFFGEKGKGSVNGTFYYAPAKPISYFWHILDQVLVRPSLLERFDEDSLRIVSSVGKTSLLTKDGIIRKEISDHLPVVFEVKISESDDTE